MQTNICDICKKEVGQFELRTLQSHLQSNRIKHLCNECNDELVTMSLRMESAISDIKISWLKKIMNQWKAKHSGE